MEIKRVWAMPDRWTFTIKPIKKLLDKYVGDGKGWIDPFAGMHSPAEFRNDHRKECNADYHMDAFDFISCFDGEYNGCLFDPPYSIHEVKRHYDEVGLEHNWKTDPTGGFIHVKKAIAPLIKVGGYVICFGWNSNGLGKPLGFKKVQILLVAHGGNRNDTIVTIEQKVQSTLNLLDECQMCKGLYEVMLPDNRIVPCPTCSIPHEEYFDDTNISNDKATLNKKNDPPEGPDKEE